MEPYRQSLRDFERKGVQNQNRVWTSREELLDLGLTSERLKEFLPKLPDDPAKANSAVYLYQRIIFCYLGSRLDAVPRYQPGLILVARDHLAPLSPEAVAEGLTWLRDKNVLKAYQHRTEAGERVIEITVNLAWALFREPKVKAIAESTY
jgi:hypothetical protein